MMTSIKWLVALMVAASLGLAACSEDGGDDSNNNNNNSDTSGASDTSGTSGSDTSGGTSGSDTSGSTSGDTSGTTDPCGDVTLQGTCAGSVVTYCGEDDDGNPELVTYDCAEFSATCETINADYGVDCVTPANGNCDSIDGDFCSGANPACVEGDGQSLCQENSGLTCDPAQELASCEDNTVVFGCFQEHTVIARDCAATGKTCGTVNTETGADCIAAPETECQPYIDYCSGDNAACVSGADDLSTCKTGFTTACVSTDDTFLSTCEGDVVVYDCLNNHTLLAQDCAAIGATCGDITPAIGKDCLVPVGGDCQTATFCGGTNPACEIGVGANNELTYTCVEAAENLCAMTTACAGNLLLLDCSSDHTATTLDCAALGGTCDEAAGSCVGATSGMFCDPDVSQCATGLTCTDPTTEDGLPTCQ